MKNFLKRFFIILPLLFCIRLFASDAITIDSLFKKQIGLRSITNLSLLSTGNANSYNLYPSISVNGDPTIWNDTKQLSLNQTLIFSLLSRLDLLVSASGSFARKEYTNFITNAYSHEMTLVLTRCGLALSTRERVLRTLCHKFHCKVLSSHAKKLSMSLKLFM